MLLVPPINLMVLTGKKVKVYDLRLHSIARLHFILNQFDWATVLSCSDDVSFVYNQILNSIKMLTESSLPTKTVKIGPRDPSYLSPAIKVLLAKRNK